MTSPAAPRRQRNMAEKGSTQGSGAKQQPLTPEQMALLRRREMAQWANSGKLRTRNIITGLAIGGVVLGIYGYTFFSVSQEKFLDELEEEAKVVRANYPKTSAN
ncbi:cytochrome c oxidase assembly factor 3 homolog, mitochondrial [Dendrobates tinctorius]|uniref:cytochrome c oxidase assembly factor 3 homolog, mitochondrial n=1 Tax=Dendrobates tinctorius TaxID=92724 RepID=UPI003CCA6550